MQKFYWNNAACPGYCPPARDHHLVQQHGPGYSKNTLTLAINNHNYSHQLQPTNNRRTIKTNEAVCIRNNDNEFVQPKKQIFREVVSDIINIGDSVQHSEQPGAKSIHLNSDYHHIQVNANKHCIQVNQSYLKDVAGNKSVQGSGANKVVLKLGDISSEAAHRSCSQQSRWRYNKTWNENMKGKYRQSIQSADIFQHDYENVYSGRQTSIGEMKSEKKEPCLRQTPRSRKKSKHPAPGTIVRSKSCERVAGVIDKLSEKLSLVSLDRDIHSLAPTTAPPTPTPSILHSVAARAIPCVDIKVSDNTIET